MSEYRSVNFYELCRLCAATQGTKLNLFSESGRKQDLAAKILESLPVHVEEHDELPKTICELCVQQVLQISEYRQKCSNTDAMLRGCLGSPKLKNEGRVYIKDEAAKAGPGGSKPATNIVTLKNMKQTLVPLGGSQQQQQQQQHQQIQTQQVQIQHQLDPNTMTISAGNDYLSSIVQQVGINDGSDQPQYTYTIQEVPQQKMTDQQRIQTYSQVDEFLKPKTDGGNKMQYNLVVNNNQLQQITTSSAGTVVSSPQVKQVITNNTPFVLTNSATGMRTQVQQQQQQQQQQQGQQKIQMVQTPQKAQQCMIIKDNSQQVYQIKLEPQMSTVDGQTIYQLTQAPTQTFQTITPQQQQQQQKVVSSINPLQFTTLTNVASNSTKGSPTMITIQDTPGKGQTATQITPVGRIASTTITRKTPLVLKQDSGGQTQVKYVTQQVMTSQGNNVTQSTPIIVQSASTSNGGAPKLVASKTPRTIVLGNKTVKMISATTAQQQQQQQTQQTTVKAVVAASPKIIPLQTFNKHEETYSIELEVEKTNKPTCDVCQKEFKRKEHLAQHMKLHQGVRPFKCDQCDKAFNRKEHLLRHRTSHTGAKSFKCEHCQKMFSRKDNLNKHKRKHNGGGDDESGEGKMLKLDDEDPLA